MHSAHCGRKIAPQSRVGSFLELQDWRTLLHLHSSHPCLEREKQTHRMSLRGHGWGFQTRKLSQEHLRMKDHLEAPGQLSPLPPTDSCGHSPAPSLGWPRLTANLDPQNPQKGSPLSLHDPLPRYWGAFAPTLKDIESWGQRNAVLTASVFHQNHWVPIASEVCQLT